MYRLNILVLHSLGDPNLAPAFLSNHVFALSRYFPEHNYLYHDTSLALPSYVMDAQFDAIILDVTFLAIRWGGLELLDNRKNAYAFVKDSSAIKIALPQDEYDCNELLDDWMCDWHIDIVYSVISSNWQVLYPRYHAVGEIRLGYTGYVDESLIDRTTKLFSNRSIDIGYRTRKLPPYFGRIGEVKWTIGRDVAAMAKGQGLKVDIEVGESATILGDNWYNFIENCKFTLGSNSGSSMLDPRGEIQKAVKKFLYLHPQATFEEVENACFYGRDGQNVFTAISPRILEAGLLNSAQILVEGAYSGIIQAGEHFIPIQPDANNFADVLSAMSDITLVKKMIKNCREAILSVDALRCRNNARSMLELIANKSANNLNADNLEKIKLIINRYNQEMTPKFKLLFLKNKLRNKFSKLVRKTPLIYKLLRLAAGKYL